MIINQSFQVILMPGGKTTYFCSLFQSFKTTVGGLAGPPCSGGMTLENFTTNALETGPLEFYSTELC